MNKPLILQLMLYGFIVAEQCYLTVVFYRFWRQSRERLFAFFAAGFFLMAIHRISLGFAVGSEVTLEEQTAAYLWRLASYALIFVGIVAKNLQTRRR